MINDRQRIRHILQAIGKIAEATSCGREEFLSCSLKRDAVSYNFLIIGEAANQISADTQMAHPEIPWRVIVGMRNILIHDYVQTDYGMMWKTAKDDLPELRKQLDNLLDALPSSD